jgi:hypothetical protein
MTLYFTLEFQAASASLSLSDDFVSAELKIYVPFGMAM